MHTQSRHDELKLNDPRFDELMDLAREGNEEAIRDLWLEFEYDFNAADEQDCLMDAVDWFLAGGVA